MQDGEAPYFEKQSMENKMLHPLMESTLTKEKIQTTNIEMHDFVTLI
jgi:hypothetical protein